MNKRQRRAYMRRYMRKWRKANVLTPEQKRKDASRSYAGVYKRRGILVPKPCEFCGSEKAEMHHGDYNRPLDVRWFCREHHIEYHQLVRPETQVTHVLAKQSGLSYTRC